MFLSLSPLPSLSKISKNMFFLKRVLIFQKQSSFRQDDTVKTKQAKKHAHMHTLVFSDYAWKQAVIFACCTEGSLVSPRHMWFLITHNSVNCDSRAAAFG